MNLRCHDIQILNSLYNIDTRQVLIGVIRPSQDTILISRIVPMFRFDNILKLNQLHDGFSEGRDHLKLFECYEAFTREIPMGG